MARYVIVQAFRGNTNPTVILTDSKLVFDSYMYQAWTVAIDTEGEESWCADSGPKRKLGIERLP